jgi:hypothetical protein
MKLSDYTKKKSKRKGKGKPIKRCMKRLGKIFNTTKPGSHQRNHKYNLPKANKCRTHTMLTPGARKAGAKIYMRKDVWDPKGYQFHVRGPAKKKTTKKKGTLSHLTGPTGKAYTGKKYGKKKACGKC